MGTKNAVSKAERRRRLFSAACALAGITQEKWAEAEGKITPQHLSTVLNEGRESDRLCAKVDAFIAKHLTAQAVA